jgi:hypothetical protein
MKVLYFFSRAGSRSSYTRATRRPTCSEELAEGAGRAARKASGQAAGRAAGRRTRRSRRRAGRAPITAPSASVPAPITAPSAAVPAARSPVVAANTPQAKNKALKRCSKGGSIAAHVVSIPIESEHARHVARRVGASPPRHLREHCTRDRQILATHAIVTDEGGHQGAIRGHQGPSEVIRGSRTLRCCTT